MGIIFAKPKEFAEYYDQVEIGGYPFEAHITLTSKRGDPSAIHCGRIVIFELVFEDTMITYYDEGRWMVEMDELILNDYLDPEFYDCAVMARDILIAKWSNPERIRMKTRETKEF